MVFLSEISGQSLIKGNCHNFRTGHDTDMKLGPKTTFDKGKIANVDDDVMSENCDVIIIFLIYGQFEAIWKPDSGGIVYKTYIFINSSLLYY